MPSISKPMRSSNPVSAITIRHLRTIDEFQRCVDLEREVWALGDMDLVPATIFSVAVLTGGQAFAAFEESGSSAGRMIGFTLSLAGVRDGRGYLHSHMTAVIPEFQNQGVGRKLKLFQREDALARGIGLVEWTFDPLETRNAWFNMARLGAIVRRYIPDFYGRTTSPLHAGLPTDRLLCEWMLASRRVRSILSGESAPASALQGAERIHIPAAIRELRHTDIPEAERIQTAARERFQSLFARNYAVVGVEVRPEGADYVLVPWTRLEGDLRED